VANDPHAVSPWRVIAVQAAVGILVALLSGLVSAKWNVFWSALYGAGVVVVPGALMARGMTSALSRVSPGASAVSFMSWEFVKIGVSVVLLVLATRIVQPLSWPALLVAAAVCIKVYWLALAWRRRR
jgi:ATP synthase protein I